MKFTKYYHDKLKSLKKQSFWLSPPWMVLAVSMDVSCYLHLQGRRIFYSEDGSSSSFEILVHLHDITEGRRENFKFHEAMPTGKGIEIHRSPGIWSTRQLFLEEAV
jgi:hypothetical protein